MSYADKFVLASKDASEASGESGHDKTRGNEGFIHFIDVLEGVLKTLEINCKPEFTNMNEKIMIFID